MNILFVNPDIHAKNLNALTKYNIIITSVYNANLDTIDLSKYDVVYSPSHPIDVSKYPGVKFIFGPHFSVFPEQTQMKMIEGKHAVYIQPSEWAQQAWQKNQYCNNINIRVLPFGVDTNQFNEIIPISQRKNVFIYFKRRIPSELSTVYNFLVNHGFHPLIFDYVKHYNEVDYVNCLHNSKFGVWLDAHESQGFALQEALACNVPLLVWNVFSMNQSYGSGCPNIAASTIPYWSDNCGEYFTDVSELKPTFDKLLQNLDTYKPREFILENLSIEKCSAKFIDLVNNIQT